MTSCVRPACQADQMGAALAPVLAAPVMIVQDLQVIAGLARIDVDPKAAEKTVVAGRRVIGVGRMVIDVRRMVIGGAQTVTAAVLLRATVVLKVIVVARRQVIVEVPRVIVVDHRRAHGPMK